MDEHAPGHDALRRDPCMDALRPPPTTILTRRQGVETLKR
jgi:hypothetical protein